MVMVCENKLQSMLPRLEFDLDFGLAFSKMTMAGIAGNRLVQCRQLFNVYQEMMVAGIIFFHSSRSHPHAFKAETNRKGAGYRVSVRWRYYVSLCSIRRFALMFAAMSQGYSYKYSQ